MKILRCLKNYFGLNKKNKIFILDLAMQIFSVILKYFWLQKQFFKPPLLTSPKF
jgi:hypothetical protein